MRMLLIGCVLGLLLAPTAEAQDVASFERELRHHDSQQSLLIGAESNIRGHVDVYVTDGWYSIQCFKRQRLAQGLQQIWRRHGGDVLEIRDRAETKVADYQLFSEDYDIRGCG